MKPLLLLIPILILGCKKEDPVSLKHIPKLDISLVYNSPDKEDDAISITNLSANDVNLGGYTLGNKSNPNAYTFPNTQAVKFNEGRKFTYNVFQFEIMNNDSTELVILKNPEGEIEDIWSFKR